MSVGSTFQFRSKSILAYYKRKKKARLRSAEQQQSIDQLLEYAHNKNGKERYSGLVTSGSQKRLTRAIENLLQVAQPKKLFFEGKEYQFKVNFITLTLYSYGRQVPGKEAHKNCLEPLLKWLRSKGMTSYVWKAELQSKRKDCHQLHYHLTTDVYIDCILLRDKWNQLQRDSGYLDYYHKKYHHWNPNSTDVHATYNKKNLVAYLKKAIVRYSDKKKYEHLRNQYLVRGEMAKTIQNKDTVYGKVWDCSINLKVSFFEIEAYANITAKIAQAVSLGEMRKKEFERCTVYELVKTSRPAWSYLPYLDRIFYEDHINKMRNFQRLKPDIHAFSDS